MDWLESWAQLHHIALNPLIYSLNLEPVDVNEVRKILADCDKNNWLNGIRNKPKLDFLLDIKPEMGVEPFVKINISKYERSLLAQMRYGILQIQLETGRYCNNEKREDPLCKICNRGVVEDQNHFVWHCTAYNEIRDTFVQLISGRHADWDNSINDTDKFVFLFRENPRALAKYVKNIFMHRKGFTNSNYLVIVYVCTVIMAHTFSTS